VLLHDGGPASRRYNYNPQNGQACERRTAAPPRETRFSQSV